MTSTAVETTKNPGLRPQNSLSSGDIFRNTLAYTHTKIVKRVKEEGVGREGHECCVWTENADFGATLKSHFSVTLDVRSFSNPKVIEQAEWWDPLEIQSPQSALCAVYTAHICESLKNVA